MEKYGLTGRYQPYIQNLIYRPYHSFISYVSKCQRTRTRFDRRRVIGRLRRSCLELVLFHTNKNTLIILRVKENCQWRLREGAVPKSELAPMSAKEKCL